MTLVLYSGKGRWNFPTNIRELVEVPKQFEPFLNNYQIKVIPMEYYDEFFDKEALHTQDLQSLFRGLQLMYQKKEKEFLENLKTKKQMI